MGRGTLIRPSKVKGYVANEWYTSKMLLDHLNSESTKIQINHGVVKKGGNLLPSSAHGKLGEGYDETYVILKGKCKLELDGEMIDIEAGDILFIPGGVYHGVDNTDGEEDLELLTIWAGVPEKEGINIMYDRRLKEWGKSYVEVDA